MSRLAWEPFGTCKTSRRGFANPSTIAKRREMKLLFQLKLLLVQLNLPKWPMAAGGAEGTVTN